MGCDFYCYTQLQVKVGPDTVTLNLAQDAGWVGDFDSDNLTFDQQREAEMTRRSSRKVLMQEGQWLIQNEAAIQEYQRLLTVREIDLALVTGLTKVTWCAVR